MNLTSYLAILLCLLVFRRANMNFVKGSSIIKIVTAIVKVLIPSGFQL